MDRVIEVECLPVCDGFAVLRDTVARWPDPVQVRTDREHAKGFSAVLRHTDLGRVQVGSLTTSGPVSFGVERGQRLIRRSDPDAYRFLFSIDGDTGVRQGGRDATLAPGDVGLHDTSQPLHGWRRAYGERARLLMATVPRTALALPANRVRALTGMNLSRASPVAGLVTTMVTQIVADAPRYSPAEAIRVSAVLIDLISVLLAGASESPTHAAPEAHQNALLAQVQKFIEQHLDEPDLSPATVAAAHHLAPRTLDRLFAAHELSVAGWIRHRRLERCRRDLADPALAAQPIYAIATRRGFADGPHLTRLFKAAYGMSPQQYRQHQRPDHTPALPLPNGDGAVDRDRGSAKEA